MGVVRDGEVFFLEQTDVEAALGADASESSDGDGDGKEQE